MNKFRGRVPNFVDAGKLPEFEFNTEEELLANKWFEPWLNDKNLLRFEYAKIFPEGWEDHEREYGDGYKYHIMAIVNKGLLKKPEHWVIGKVASLDGLSFKQWNGG